MSDGRVFSLDVLGHWEITFTLAEGFGEDDALRLYEHIEAHPATAGAALTWSNAEPEPPGAVGERDAAKRSEAGVRRLLGEAVAENARLKNEIAVLKLALGNACGDAWTDDEAAMAQYVRRAEASLARCGGR